MKIGGKSSKKLSLKVWALFFFAVAIAIISFVLNKKIVEDSKKHVSELTFSEKINVPNCSQEGGFYKTDISINLSTDKPDLTIYYTVDGTQPTLNSTKYSGPIKISDKTEMRSTIANIPTSPRWKPPIGNVFKGTVLRAIAVDENNFKSNELVKSFFISDKGNKRYSFPVISITVNEKDFFGYQKGIYVMGKSYADKDNYIRKNTPLYSPWWYYPANYLLRGENAERKAYMELYEPDGKPGFASNVSIRINGNATRAFSQKSLRIYFKKKHSSTPLNYPLFPNNKVQTFSSFILRNSGNDWDKTMFRDAFMQSLMKNAHVETQDFRPSIVFINGEYWGIHNIRERMDANYLANKYKIKADSISILELGGNLISGQKNSQELFIKLLNYFKKEDLSVPKNYEYIKSQMDIESFIDFVIANVYFCNSDWPSNNVRYWRYDKLTVKDSINIKDGKWRWMLYDTDWGFGYTSKNAYQMNLLPDAKLVGSVGTIFGALTKNKEFVDEFISSFKNKLETSFRTENTLKVIDEFERNYEPEIQEHINRWRAIMSYAKWKENVDDLRTFASKRPAIQAKQLNDFFKLTGNNQIKVN